MVFLGASKWRENISIRKSLTLCGAGKDSTSLWGQEAGRPVIRIESDEEIEVSIQGMTITDAIWEFDRPCHPDGIYATGRVRVLVTNVDLLDNARHGIALDGPAQAALRDSTIGENRREGIYLQGSTRLTAEHLHIVGNLGAGLEARGTAQVEMTASNVERNQESGISLAGSAQCAVKGSILENNWLWGLWLCDSAGARVVECIVLATGDEMDRGVSVAGGARLVMARSTVARCERGGIELRGGATAELVENRILDGVVLCRSSSSRSGKPFAGYVTGRGNLVALPAELYRGRGVASCSGDLAFLETEKGGELDWREERPM